MYVDYLSTSANFESKLYPCYDVTGTQRTVVQHRSSSKSS